MRWYSILTKQAIENNDTVDINDTIENNTIDVNSFINSVTKVIQSAGWDSIVLMQDSDGDLFYKGGVAEYFKDERTDLDTDYDAEDFLEEIEYKVNEEIMKRGTPIYDWDDFPESWQTLENVMGYTENMMQAGYIGTDGSLLDLSEGQRTRVLDHRSISHYRPGGSPWTGGMQEYMNEGNIRINPEGGTMQLLVAPTQQQKYQISNFVKLHKEMDESSITVDLRDGLGEYDERNEYYSSSERIKTLNFDLETLNEHYVMKEIMDFFSETSAKSNKNYKESGLNDHNSPMLTYSPDIIDKALDPKGPKLPVVPTPYASGKPGRKDKLKKRRTVKRRPGPDLEEGNNIPSGAHGTRPTGLGF